jgi:parallel beta-helix repeat protein
MSLSPAVPSLFPTDQARPPSVQIHSNGAEGILITTGADPLLQKNGIRDNTAGGVRITSGGRGRLLRNRIERNGQRGLWAEEGCKPVRELNYVQANAMDDGTEGRADAEGRELEGERAEMERAEEVGVEGGGVEGSDGERG